jgi:hypothetical protein
MSTHTPIDFSIDMGRLKLLGVLDPRSPAAMATFSQNQFSSQERLFFSLWASRLLNDGVFKIGEMLTHKGEIVVNAHIIISGELDADNGAKRFTLGPGSVLGLAEGLAHLPYSMTVMAKTVVTTRILRLDKIDREIPKMNAGIRGICRGAVMRTLGLNNVPEALK